MTMSYKIILSANKKYITCHVNTPMTVELSHSMCKKKLELGRTSGINRYLMDVRNAPNISKVSENYQFCKHDILQYNPPKDAKAAILIDPDDRSHDFTEFAMQKSGFNIKIFEDFNEAVAWLED